MGQGQLLAVLGASLPLLFRLGMGATAAGYRGSIDDKPQGRYAVSGPGNKALVESSVRPNPFFLQKRGVLATVRSLRA